MNKKRDVAIKSAHAFFGKGPASDLSPEIVQAMERLRALAKPRDTRVADMLLAGRYWYTDQPGVPAVQVEVNWIDGEAWVTFPPMGEDVGFECKLRDMAAWGREQEHFRRIA